MEKKNTGMKVAIIVLTILVVGLTGYIVYDKVFSDKDINIADKNNNESNQNDNNNYDADKIAKEKMPVAISFINQTKNASVYCGAFEGDMIYYMDISMDASKKFTTFEQLKDHLKKNLSEELINENLMDEENYYLEKDGKLYCHRAAKGFEWLFIHDEDKINEDNIITYKISNKQESSFNVTIEAKYGLLGSDEIDQLVIINSTLTKINNNWLVTKYEQNEK